MTPHKKIAEPPAANKAMTNKGRTKAFVRGFEDAMAYIKELQDKGLITITFNQQHTIMEILKKVNEAFKLINVSEFARRYYKQSKFNLYYKLHRSSVEIPAISKNEAISMVRGFDNVAKIATEAANEMRQIYGIS